MGVEGWVVRSLHAFVGAVVVLCPQVALAHGGLEASAFILDPEDPGRVVDDSFRFRWFDASDFGAATASTTHSFFYTEQFPPPWPVFRAPEGLEGRLIVQGVPERETTNAFTWRTATVAAGAYWLWSVASDPDLAFPFQSIVFAPFPVVVAHPGDPVHPFATLETPDSPASFAEDDRYELRYAVFDPDRSAQVRIDRALDGTSTFEPVATLEGREGRGAITVDTSAWPPGDHVLRIRLEDARGLTFTSFARFTLLVARSADAGVPSDASPDLGPSGAPDAGVADAESLPPDAASAVVEPAPASAEGCSAVCTRGIDRVGFVLLLALVSLRRRRTGRTERDPS